MAGEWETVPLQTLIEPGRGISYGIVQPGQPVNNGVPMVRVSDIRDGRIATESPLMVSPEIEAAYSRTRLKGGELLLTLVGTVGEVAIVPTALAGWNIARAVAVIPVRKDIGAYWVKLALRAPAVRQSIDSHQNTTVQATLNLRDVAQLPIILPPHQVRSAIAHILGALDDKIELNRRTNATLEEMARALFKSWFVDFDPVRAKMARQETGLPGEIAALFPDAFRGEIPEGWTLGSVYESADVIYGAPFASSLFNSQGVGLPLIRIRDLSSEKPSVFTNEISPKGYFVKPGDIVVGMDGEFRAHLWGGAQSWLNQRICVFQPRAGFSSGFVFHSIIGPLANVEATETATTVIHLGKSDIDRFKIVIPDWHILSVFDRLVGPLFKRIVSNKQQSRTLAALRDTLLPKLISGELRVAEAEKDLR